MAKRTALCLTVLTCMVILIAGCAALGQKYVPVDQDGKPLTGSHPVSGTEIILYTLIGVATSRVAGVIGGQLPPPWGMITSAILGGSGLAKKANGSNGYSDPENTTPRLPS